jgi:hypothetical protein
VCAGARLWSSNKLTFDFIESFPHLFTNGDVLELGAGFVCGMRVFVPGAIDSVVLEIACLTHGDRRSEQDDEGRKEGRGHAGFSLCFRIFPFLVFTCALVFCVIELV